VEFESPRRVLQSAMNISRRGRPNKEHEDWLRSHGKTLSFVDNDGGGGGVVVSVSPPRLNRKGDCVLLFLCVIVARIIPHKVVVT
jgi:hypothetical protein